MSTPRKRFIVRRGNAHLTVYPWTHPGSGKAAWRYAWRENESSPWRYVTRATKTAAETSAWEKLGEIDQGGLIWSALSPDARRFHESVHRLSQPVDYPAVIAFLESRRKSAEVVVSVARFLHWKVATKGEKTRNLENVRRILDPMAARFAGRCLVDITPAELLEWWQARTTGLSKKTGNEVRGALVGFFNWAVWDGIHPKVTTAADKIPRTDPDKAARRVLSPVELISLLTHVAPEFRACVVLGAFAGMRPEEIAPPRKKGMSKAGKRGLLCEEIDWTFKVIRLPAEVSKQQRDGDRLIPLTEACIHWLQWAGITDTSTGPVAPRSMAEEGETIRLGKLVFGDGWPQDALRHSFGSYRNAVIRNLPQVAEEMGNSVVMLKRHYHNPKAREEGEEWFSLRPEMIRCDPMESPATHIDELAAEFSKTLRSKKTGS